MFTKFNINDIYEVDLVINVLEYNFNHLCLSFSKKILIVVLILIGKNIKVYDKKGYFNAPNNNLLASNLFSAFISHVPIVHLQFLRLLSGETFQIFNHYLVFFIKLHSTTIFTNRVLI